jgi:hypothetical protein
MPTLNRIQPGLLLLLSLVAMIVLHPVLDQGVIRRLFMQLMIFVPVLLATIRLSEIKHRVWPAVFLMSASMIFAVAAAFWPHPGLLTMKWALLAVFFALTVAGLFSYLRNARSVTEAHLFTAISIYLLLGMLWFSLYCAIDICYPGSILLHSTSSRETELLYFSLVTLSTVGYGDIVPLYGEVRMLAALEAITGILYIAITVAILVSSFRHQDGSR